MSVFGESDSRCLSNFLQTHIFWIFDHISRIYNQIKYRNIWFEKVTIILIMTVQVLFFDVFFEKDLQINAIELFELCQIRQISRRFKFQMLRCLVIVTSKHSKEEFYLMLLKWKSIRISTNKSCCKLFEIFRKSYKKLCKLIYFTNANS